MKELLVKPPRVPRAKRKRVSAKVHLRPTNSTFHACSGQGFPSCLQRKKRSARVECTYVRARSTRVTDVNIMQLTNLSIDQNYVELTDDVFVARL